MKNTDAALIEAVESVRAAKKLVHVHIDRDLDDNVKEWLKSRTVAVARDFNLSQKQAQAAIIAAAFNCHISKESIVECRNDGDTEGLAFCNGRLVHYQNNRVANVSLKQSVLVWAKLEREAAKWPDGGHIPEARAKWFRMVANAIR